MSGKSLEARVRALEEKMPDDIVLTLGDGSTVEHPGPALDFYNEASAQIERKRGPLYEAARRVVGATGFGRLHELLYAQATGPVADDNERSQRNASHGSRKRAR